MAKDKYLRRLVLVLPRVFSRSPCFFARPPTTESLERTNENLIEWHIIHSSASGEKKMSLNLLCSKIVHSFFTGARIDHGHHAGQAVRAVTDAVAMAKAVSRAVTLVDKGDHVT